MQDNAPGVNPSNRLFTESQFKCTRGCALIAPVTLSCQVRLVTARQSSSPVSMAAGDLHPSAPLMPPAKELTEMLR